MTKRTTNSLHEHPKRETADRRTQDEILTHYQLERRLANQLRNSSRSDRMKLYSEVYDELYTQVPNHPSVVRKASPDHDFHRADSQLRFLNAFLAPDTEFMEIGPGSCALSLTVAPLVKQVRAIDVSAEVTNRQDLPDNFQLIITDGVSIPVSPETIDVAYSNQLMEHLHPDDARDQLTNIFQALKPGGIYICITPNRLNGPHDISKHFDRVATGLHLHEYTSTELCEMFRDAGFSAASPYVHVRNAFVGVPPGIMRAWEYALSKLPFSSRATLGRLVHQVRVIGEK